MELVTDWFYFNYRQSLPQVHQSINHVFGDIASLLCNVLSSRSPSPLWFIITSVNVLLSCARQTYRSQQEAELDAVQG